MELIVRTNREVPTVLGRKNLSQKTELIEPLLTVSSVIRFWKPTTWNADSCPIFENNFNQNSGTIPDFYLVVHV